MKFKAKITFEFQYDVDLSCYETDDFARAIEIDQVQALENPLEFIDLVAEKNRVTVQIDKV